MKNREKKNIEFWRVAEKTILMYLYIENFDIKKDRRVYLYHWKDKKWIKKFM